MAEYDEIAEKDNNLSIEAEERRLMRERRRRASEKSAKNGDLPKLPVYIARAKDTSGIDPRIVTYHDSKSPIAEQYRMLRTNIQRINPDIPPRIIGITSSLHREGKTTTTVNLSVAFAKDSQKRILLIDADLRKPRVHKLLGVSSPIGLAEVLAGRINDYHDAVQDTRIENLSILPCGRIPSNPSELLGSARMTELIGHVRKDFDYVIFDTPPVIALTDAGVLLAQLDGAVLVIQAWRTQRETIIRAQSLLQSAQVKILGFVLSNVEFFIPKYLHYYGYGYQYGYYQY